MTITKSQEVKEELQRMFSGEDFENKLKQWLELFNHVSVHEAESRLQMWRDEGAKSQEAKEELQRLFPGEDIDNKLNEWLALYSQRAQMAENRLQMWRDEVERQKLGLQQQENSVTDYTELNDSVTPLGITVMGFTDIGSVGQGGWTGKISLKSNESVNVDQKLSTYYLKVIVAKGDDIGNSIVQYEEINKIFSVIDKMKRARACVTEFENFEVNWTSSDGLFSLSVFNNDKGKIALMIKAGSAAFFPDNLQLLDDINVLFQRGKNYIEEHLQRVGYVGFKILEEARRAREEFSAKLPDLITERTSRYMQVLSRKFVQLTYMDEYDTREYSSFFSELDRFMGKIIPELNDDQRVVARNIISEMVEMYASDPINNIIRIDPDMNPLDYERYCANVFLQAGWTINMTPKTGDQGADIVINSDELTAVVQCKLYSQPVGNGAVQEVIAAREYYQAPIAIVVSNATFTTSARQLAAIANVVLMHHNEIETYSGKLGVKSIVVPIEKQV